MKRLDWYESYDEINAEMQEMFMRSLVEEDEPMVNGKVFIGSGEDICVFQMKEYHNGI